MDILRKPINRLCAKNTGFLLMLGALSLGNVGNTWAEDSSVIVSVSQQSEKKITGKVVDTNNEPVIGANVVVKGTTNGIITDVDGNFTLTVPSNAVLQVSYIGYVAQEIKVTQKTTYAIQLVEDFQKLDEVVVVGYGTQKKVNLTGAVSSVSGDDLNKRPVINAESMLQGQVPGLRVIQNSGQPGAESIKMTVRGQGTYSSAGSDPLVLINGVPGSISNLDPSIIESVSVLKDAASAAIYGSRAANGVILVTTKKGSSIQGKNFSATYSGNFSFYSPTKMLDVVTNSVEYMELLNLAKKNSGKPGLYSQAEIDLYRANAGSIEYPSFDWVDYMFNTAFVQNHNITLNGNNEKTSFNISLNYADQPGTMRGFDYTKYNFTLDLTSQLTKWLKVGTYISAFYGDRTEPRTGAVDAFASVLAQAPTYMPWLPNEVNGQRRYTFSAYPGVEESNKNVPAMIANNINVGNKTYDMNGQFFFEVSPIKGLKWHTKLAGRLYDDKKKDWSGMAIPLYNYHTGEYAMDMDLGGGFIRGFALEDTRTVYTNIYSFVDYTVPFSNTDHKLTAMVGYNQEMETKEYSWAKRRSYQFELPELDAGSKEDMENSGKTEQWALMSGFFRVNYDYKGIYLAEVNGRYDGTSRIAKDGRWSFFPSFSLGYRISEEDFIKNLQLSWLNNLKIRASWGQLGNQNIGLYPYQALVSLVDNYSFDNSTLTQGVAQTAYVNRDLKWETTTSTDVGIDVNLFNKLNVVFEWYKKKTTNILREAQVSNFIGLTPPTINDGEMLNKGIELNVGWTDRITSGKLNGLRYFAGFTFDRSRNKLVKFGADEKKSYTILREGLPYNSFYMLDAIGIFATQEEIDNAPKQFSDDTKPGDIRYRDANGDGKIDSDDRVVMDGRFPNFEYTFNAGLSWKNWDFSFMLQGVQGRSIYTGRGHGVTPFVQGSAPTRDYIENMWTEENPYSAEHPRLYYADMGGGSKNTRESSYYLRNASYLRLKNISIGYTLPQTWTKKAAIERLKLFVTGDNLFTITNYGGLDPEQTDDGSYAVYPQNKVISLGVNVEF